MTSGDTLTISVTSNETHAQLQIIDTGKGSKTYSKTPLSSVLY